MQFRTKYIITNIVAMSSFDRILQSNGHLKLGAVDQGNQESALVFLLFLLQVPSGKLSNLSGKPWAGGRGGEREKPWEREKIYTFPD